MPHTPRRRSRPTRLSAHRRLGRGMWVRPLLTALLGAAMAFAAGAADRRGIGAGVLSWVAADPAGARGLLVGMAGAAFTATSVVFWIRGMLVSMSSSRLAPRLLLGYLHDRWQQGAIAFMTLLFGYAAVAAAALGPSSPPPRVAVAAGIAVAALALVVIAGIIDDSIRGLRGDKVIDLALGSVLQSVDAAFPPAEKAGGEDQAVDPAGDPAEARRPVRSSARGWVARIDAEQLARSAPDGGRVEVAVRVGQYVPSGTVLYRTSTDGADGDHDAEEGVAGIRLVQVRDLTEDLELGARILADTASRALAPSSRDTPTAMAALGALVTLLGEVLSRPAPPQVQRCRGRVVVHGDRLCPEDLLDVLDAVVRDAAVDRRIATWLDGLLDELARDLRARDLPGRADLVDRLADDGRDGGRQRVGPAGG